MATRIRAYTAAQQPGGGRDRRALSACNSCIPSTAPGSPVCVDIQISTTGTISNSQLAALADAKVDQTFNTAFLFPLSGRHNAIFLAS